MCFNQEVHKKKQANDFFVEFDSELADFKENFMIFNKCVHDLIERSVTKLWVKLLT